MTPTTKAAELPEARLAAYVARRKKSRQIHHDEIHAFDTGCETEAVLLLSDIEALLAHVEAAKQAQAGACPMSHEAAKALVRKYGNDPLHLVLQVERHHGIKGGQP